MSDRKFLTLNPKDFFTRKLSLFDQQKGHQSTSTPNIPCQASATVGTQARIQLHRLSCGSAVDTFNEENIRKTTLKNNLCLKKKCLDSEATVSENRRRCHSEADAELKAKTAILQIPKINIVLPTDSTPSPTQSSIIHNIDSMEQEATSQTKPSAYELNVKAVKAKSVESLSALRKNKSNDDVKSKLSRSASSINALIKKSFSTGAIIKSSMAPTDKQAAPAGPSIDYADDITNKVSIEEHTEYQQQQQQQQYIEHYKDSSQDLVVNPRLYLQQYSSPERLSIITSSTPSSTPSYTPSSTPSSAASPSSPASSSPTTSSVTSSTTSSSVSSSSNSDYPNNRSLKHSKSTPLVHVQSTTSLRSLSPSGRSGGNSTNNTAKQEHSSLLAAATVTATTAASVAAAATSSSSACAGGTGAGTGTGNGGSVSIDKEKSKSKEVSSSRVKKFHRHFSQVSKDEKLINYFSCALVSDILLQGHLYITDKHFAFYSNVFGYVTKVVIPTSSVRKISKEKTAKIIPNAVGVATTEERHVFGSFISREAAFRLMCSVCPPLEPTESLPKDSAQLEVCEEFSIEDESSCSISGNESSAQATENSSAAAQQICETSQIILRRPPANTTLCTDNVESALLKKRNSDIPLNTKAASKRASTPPKSCVHTSRVATASSHSELASKYTKTKSFSAPSSDQPIISDNTPYSPETHQKITFIAGSTTSSTSTTSSPTTSTSSSPTLVMAESSPYNRRFSFLRKMRAFVPNAMPRIIYPTDINIVYVGAVLTVILGMLTMFLFYRIQQIESRAELYKQRMEFNWRSNSDDEIFGEALRLQRELQNRNTQEARNIIKMNLKQINKVRRSLETLAGLVHDRLMDSSNDSYGNFGDIVTE